ncbi:ABC-three component system protein [Streptomyces sp. NPDC056492]|uniref:ABC-three component system protein n=1 Tax=unclassified Streptomyces TaxID=2593676 RepID=UPI0036A9B51A
MNDRIMALYEMAFRDRYQESFEDEFQEFFSNIMEKVHPDGDFVRVRPWGKMGDRKNDGYLISQRTVFAVYAPRKPTASGIRKKVRTDFAGCLPHWDEYLDRWVFVHNDREGLGPDALKAIMEINKAQGSDVASPWGREALRKRVMDLDISDLRSLFPDVPTFADFIEAGMEQIQPVLDHLERSRVPAKPDLRPVPEDKMEFNLLSDHTRHLITLGMQPAQVVRNYYRRVSDELLRDQTAQAFSDKYANLRSLGLGPDEIYWELRKWVGGLGPSSPSREVGVYGVLSYFFEECDIFLRPEEGSQCDLAN